MIKNKSGQAVVVLSVLIAVILFIAVGIVAVAYAQERGLLDSETGLKEGFHPVLDNCDFPRTIEEFDLQKQFIGTKVAVNTIELECTLKNQGNQAGDVFVEMGIIPRVTARAWGWSAPALAIFGGKAESVREDSCCQGNPNIRAVHVRGLPAGGVQRLNILVEVPHSTELGIGLIRKSSDACGDNTMWDGAGDKYVTFAHIFNRCFTANEASGSRGEVLESLQIVEV